MSLLASAGFDMLNHTFTMSLGNLEEFVDKVRLFKPRIDVVSIHVSLPSLSENWCLYPNGYIRLHRQRAWPLFSDPARRPGPELPLLETYVNALVDESQVPEFRHGLSSPGVRNEYIAHGAGIWTDSFFLKLGKVSFWKVGENVHKLPGKRNAVWLKSEDGGPKLRGGDGMPSG